MSWIRPWRNGVGIVKRLFIAWLISLLLIGCSQPNTQEIETPVPDDEAEQVIEVTAPTNSEPLSTQKGNLIPAEEQTVQVTFTQAALDQISQDLDDPSKGDKVLKVKPAID